MSRIDRLKLQPEADVVGNPLREVRVHAVCTHIPASLKLSLGYCGRRVCVWNQGELIGYG
jgi:hypothetical protein